ncbi:right-handed parallel beta-helix repeat-containing protein [candidate division KSB1 bacterium]|nr:right-handed parallel beta-helix repeat-containing protein [candidate division KSB1 bacterium]
MKHILFFLVLSSALSTAETFVTGPTVSGEWSISNSPYIIKGDIQIAAGDTLKIYPGVTVLFDSPYQITVNGVCLAIGLPDSQIVFTSNRGAEAAAGDWKSLNLNSIGSKFRHCIFEYGGGGFLYASPLMIRHGCRIDSCTIRFSANRGIIIVPNVTSSVNITGCEIYENNETGIFIDKDVYNVQIINCLVWKNTKHGIYIGGNGDTRLRGNRIIENGEDGIHLEGYNLIFGADLGRNNDEGGNSLYGNAQYQLFNLSNIDIFAQGNYWFVTDSAVVYDSLIYDQQENPFMGQVFFMPVLLEDASLPVHLLFFQAYIRENGVELIWETEAEFNNLGYYIYRKSGSSPYVKLNEFLIPGLGTSNRGRLYKYLDVEIGYEKHLAYRLVSVDRTGEIHQHGPVLLTIEHKVPGSLHVLQNFPNPFNPQTVIPFQLGERRLVTMIIYNTCGQKVRDLYIGELGTGVHRVVWDGKDSQGIPVPSGIYFCKVNNNPSVIKLIKTK